MTREPTIPGQKVIYANYSIYPENKQAIYELSLALRCSRSSVIRKVIDYAMAHSNDFLAWAPSSGMIQAD